MGLIVSSHYKKSGRVFNERFVGIHVKKLWQEQYIDIYVKHLCSGERFLFVVPRFSRKCNFYALSR